MHPILNTTTNVIWKTALFDLDGVVFDTEPIYTKFWEVECKRYHPETPGLEYRIKGQTLTQIFEGYFSDVAHEHPAIEERLNDFESKMEFKYIPGFVEFVEEARKEGIHTAVVTSSNRIKMQAVYRAHPEVSDFFDRILTSEDFAESKPSPDCYLKGAEAFGSKPAECVVFEDSINGLKAGMASGARVVGLSTTNAPHTIQALCHLIVPDFTGLGVAQCRQLVAQQNL